MKNEKDEVPTLKELLDFLSHRCGALETIYGTDSNQSGQPKSNQPSLANGSKGKTFNKSDRFSASRAQANVARPSGCYKCGKSHPIYACSEFHRLSAKQRIQEAQAINLCLNCLKKAHPDSECKGSCRVCFQAHNTLLHSDEGTPESKGVTAPGAVKSMANTAVVTALASQLGYEAVLGSAIINVLDQHDRSHMCRALLDSGSTSNFMTTRLSQDLQLKIYEQDIEVGGIGGTCTQSTYYTRATIGSRFNGYSAVLNFIIMDKVTGKLPVLTKSERPWEIPPHLKLADPEYYAGGEVDIVIGVGLFWDLICVGQLKLGRGLPVLQKTKLGWIIAGDLSHVSGSRRGICNLSLSRLDTQIEKFWHIEESLNHHPILSPEKARCEELFRNDVTKDVSGKFIVRLPLRGQPESLGDSFHMAHKRLESVERRFKRDPQLKELYSTFMKEYQELGHMTAVNGELPQDNQIRYYLPHHAVLRPDSTTTKLRVVFDASATTTSGKSLNDILYVGPTVQQDLLSLILRFRLHSIVLTADVEKMYRQVWIHPDHRNLQCILWRGNPAERPTTFQLNTVTYGTAAAPFLATRCLKEVAENIRDSDPLAAQVIADDFYVDDMITGADTIEEALNLRAKVSSALDNVGFHLRKWCSNSEEVIANQRSESLANTELVDFGRPEESKTLGVRWHPPADTLQYNISINVKSRMISKRSILSETAQIFDPLGLLAPAVISAKIVMQELWQLKLGWEEAVPIYMHTQWERYRENLSALNDIRLPRRVIDGDYTELQLHGFCDASEKAYGACIYIRATSQSGESSVRLLCAKSRVAPLKQRTLPSLELCAAVLLAELFQKVTTSLKINMPAWFWTDSELVLAYLADEPRRWITFIGNRVSQIQQLTDISKWRHVPGKSNPADLVSRGVPPTVLIGNELWWTGPSWLKLVSGYWPEEGQIPDEVPGRRKSVMCHLSVTKWHMIDHFSNLNDLLRQTSSCFRFYQTVRGEAPQVRDESISTNEIQHSLRILVGISQSEEFAAELASLKKGRPLNRRNLLLPFMLLLHAGPQSVLANLRLKFWIIRGRNAVKNVIRHCMECARGRPVSITPQMGHLPADRTKECRPFLSTGVDYAGPIYIKAGTRRSQTKLKGYIALFVCFSTKAIHIELVTDLSTAAFLSALRRFISRRGRIVNLYSDNGTNFVGAARQLQELTETLQSTELKDALCNEGIKWHFIPPRSPHFGGLWEAGVRSVKNHLKRILGESFLTFEEYYTVLTQIEACLNSRPITYLSDDPTDPLPLTPGHFLIGEALVSLPETDVSDTPDNQLIIWDRLQKIKQHFWK